MEEVRSYWQVASITHFCTLFQKPFKLPQFEPEELEQAFIIDVQACEKQELQNDIQIISKVNHNLENNNNDSSSEKDEYDTRSTTNSLDDSERVKGNQTDTYSSSSGYLSSVDTNNRFQPPRNTSSYSSTLNYQSLDHINNLTQPQLQQQLKVEEEQQQDLHLLVKLAIALLKPHFNSKITPNNWENYLKRLVEANWVDLEHYPSPFRVPFVSPEGIELTKNLSFNDLSLSDKIDLFTALCDYRFWCEDASDAIKDYPIEELRLESIGKDQQGYEYWYFSGTRLFREDKELTQEIISKKQRIKELENQLIEFEKDRIAREQEDKKRAELEEAKRLAQEAREARQAAKRKQEEEEEAANLSASNDSTSGTKRRRRNNVPVLPPRTGLRERRSSGASNNHESTKKELSHTPARTTRSSIAKQNNATDAKQQTQQTQTQSSQKSTRSASKNSRQRDTGDSCKNEKKNSSLELPKKPSEVECREELNSITVEMEERRAAWSIQCESLEDWESFVSKFEKTKSTNERHLYANLNECILPTIRAIYAKRAAEARRKEKEMLLSLATRRVSTRIISKKAQEEEEERRAQIREAELQKKKAEAELRLRAELEREMRAKRNRFVINGEASSNCSEDGEAENVGGRYNLRQQHDLLNDPTHEFDGIIHPDKLSDFYEALELIIDTVRTSKHAWPFVDPVPETVPGYYDLIEEPMDLKKLRTKVEFREYKSLIEVEKDFQLLINNCERFNGPKNIYTKMVYKLWKSFRKNVQLYLQRDLHMNEYETFVYPPQPPAPPPLQAPSPQPALVIQPQQQQQEQQQLESRSVPPLEKQPALIELGQQKQVASELKPEPTETIIQNNHQQSTVVSQQMALQNPQPIKEAVNPNELVLTQVVNSKLEPLSDSAPLSTNPQGSNHVSSAQTGTVRSEAVSLTEIKQEVNPIVETGNALCPETVVEEIIYDTPDNEIYIWQDSVVHESQGN